jgi:hypothetical protein
MSHTLPELEDCTCQLFVAREGDDRHWSITPRYARCTCGHSAAWHDEETGACSFPTPAAKRLRARIVEAYGEPDPEALAYWQQALQHDLGLGEAPEGKPSMADITVWNKQISQLYMAADVAGLYGDVELANRITDLAVRVADIAAEAARPKNNDGSSDHG